MKLSKLRGAIRERKGDVRVPVLLPTAKGCVSPVSVVVQKGSLLKELGALFDGVSTAETGLTVNIYGHVVPEGSPEATRELFSPKPGADGPSQIDVEDWIEAAPQPAPAETNDADWETW